MHWRDHDHDHDHALADLAPEPVGGGGLAATGAAG
jgi:hypothetical protein